MRYEFIEHAERNDWYVVTDTKWMFVCEFQAHSFNETQKFIDFGMLDGKDAQTVATAMRELGDYMYLHHYSEAFPAPTYELRLSEDDTELHIIRHKEPYMDAMFETDDLKEIASALSKAAEFIKKRMGGR
jgi:hypothetical protein